jgi:hypothetical protein
MRRCGGSGLRSVRVAARQRPGRSLGARSARVAGSRSRRRAPPSNTRVRCARSCAPGRSAASARSLSSLPNSSRNPYRDRRQPSSRISRPTAIAASSGAISRPLSLPGSLRSAGGSSSCRCLHGDGRLRARPASRFPSDAETYEAPSQQVAGCLPGLCSSTTCTRQEPPWRRPPRPFVPGARAPCLSSPWRVPFARLRWTVRPPPRRTRATSGEGQERRGHSVPA